MKMLRPSVRILSPRKRTQRTHENAERNRLYDTSRWRRLRELYFRHRPLCRMCESRGRIRAAHVLDHIHGHGPDWRERFWDVRGLQGLCRECHTEKTAAELAGGTRDRGTESGSGHPGVPDLSPASRD
jgi:5-methylcytosine-specific restriction protein A